MSAWTKAKKLFISALSIGFVLGFLAQTTLVSVHAHVHALDEIQDQGQFSTGTDRFQLAACDLCDQATVIPEMPSVALIEDNRTVVVELLPISNRKIPRSHSFLDYQSRAPPRLFC